MTSEPPVSEVCKYVHVLRDQDISYGNYIEQITHLLFLKMSWERWQPKSSKTWIAGLEQFRSVSAELARILHEWRRQFL